MQTSATDIFVSYKAEDRARVQHLVQGLEAEGFSVWWDTHIGGGTNWHEDIEQHLQAAKCVVVAWSKRSIGRDGHFVRDEARRAQRRDAYVPVCLDAVEPPLGFGEVQAISLKGWHGNRSDQRFKAVVDAVRRHVAGERVPHPRGAAHRHFHERRLSRRAAIAGGGVAAIAVAGLGAWEIFKPVGAGSNSIAVLPFANLSGNPEQAYFSDGIADEIRSALTRIAGLTVIGSTSSQAVRDDDARTAARKLGVANILTGNVRQSASTIRISAELIDGRSGADRWTQDYDRTPGDAIKIQTDIAQNVATALKGALGLVARNAITLGGTSDSASQDLILRAKNLLFQSSSADSFRKSLVLAETAIARDPGYADAYVQKAHALFNLAENDAPSPAQASERLAQADAAAQKAIALAPQLGSTHIALARIASGQLDFPSLLRESKRALALSPDDSDVLAEGSHNLAYFGSIEEALRGADRAITLDPLNARSYWVKSEVQIYARRYPDAIQAGRKALALSVDLNSAHVFVGDALLLSGKPAQAKAEYQAIGKGDPFSLLRLAVLAARSGDRDGAERVISKVKQQIGDTATYQYGEIYAQLGDADNAFAEWERAIAAKDSGLVYLKVDPFIDPIRRDPRYATLLKRLNFP